MKKKNLVEKTRKKDDIIKEQVISVIERIRPYINSDGGDIEFCYIKDGIVYVKLFGACIGCGLVENTLYDGLENMLVSEVPGIIGVMLEENSNDKKE